MIVETPSPSWKVYAHITPDGKMYVGMTGIKPWQRFGYGHGYKDIPKFHDAIVKYGWKNIQHEIIASGLTKEEALNMEKLLIQKLDLINPEYGYNTLIGTEPTPETMIKHSQSIRLFYKEHRPYPSARLGKGVLQTMEYKHNDAYTGGKDRTPGSARRVRCIDTGEEFNSVVDAAYCTGININHIYGNALGARVDAGGMQWEYLDEPKQKQHTRSESYRANKRGIKNGRAKPIRCVETGEMFETCQDLANSLEIRKSIITRVMQRDHAHLGLHYEFVNKEEILNGACV